MRVAVIGANGFIARHVNRALSAAGHEVVGIVRRRAITRLPDVAALRHVEDAGAEPDWDTLIADTDAVLHLVPPPHTESAQHASAKQGATAGVPALARSAAAAGMRRLVFVSSVKVNGEITTDGPFDATSVPKPDSTYGAAKLETELALRALSAELGLPITIVRPAAVYGDGGMGNFRFLVKLLRIMPGWLLPLAGIENRRSFIHVENLASALVRCLEDDTGRNRLFLLHDGEPVGTSALCRAILTALGRSPALAPDPFGMIRSIVTLVAPGIARRLYGSLEIDGHGISDALGWEPALTLAEGLKKALAPERSEP